MPAPSPFEILAEELGAVAGRVERESSLRIAAAIADLKRVDAERELRLAKLEQAAADRVATVKDGEPGAKGEPGESIVGPKGDLGEPGEKGDQGATGETGLPGRDGVDGKDGNDGAAGMSGTDGRDGLVGKDGIDGKDGAPGERGPEGAAGKFSAPKAFEEGAVHYESTLVLFEGATWCARCDTAQKPPHKDWSPVALKGVDAPVGEVRGLYDPKGAYLKFDVVAFNGAEWRAKKDEPGPLPGDGWAMSAKQGKRGDKGERGDRGEPGKEGKQGPAGPSVIERRIEGYTLIDMMSDGSTIACDIRSAFELYHGERSS